MVRVSGGLCFGITRIECQRHLDRHPQSESLGGLVNTEATFEATLAKDPQVLRES